MRQCSAEELRRSCVAGILRLLKIPCWAGTQEQPASFLASISTLRPNWAVMWRSRARWLPLTPFQWSGASSVSILILLFSVISSFDPTLRRLSRLCQLRKWRDWHPGSWLSASPTTKGFWIAFFALKSSRHPNSWWLSFKRRTRSSSTWSYWLLKRRWAQGISMSSKHWLEKSKWKEDVSLQNSVINSVNSRNNTRKSISLSGRGARTCKRELTSWQTTTTQSELKSITSLSWWSARTFLRSSACTVGCLISLSEMATSPFSQVSSWTSR